MRHLSDLEIERFYEHRLDREEERGILIHTAECEECAARLAELFPKSEILRVPAGLRDEILRRTEAPMRRNRQKEEISKVSPGGLSLLREAVQTRREWYRYSARVVFAMGMALLFLFGGDFSQKIAPGRQPVKQAVERVKYTNGKEHSRKPRTEISQVLQHSALGVSETLQSWSGNLGDRLRNDRSEESK